MSPSNSLSVGLPPPSFLSHPFFFHRSRFRLGMPDYLDINFTSSPARIYITIKLLFRLPAFFHHRCICGRVLWLCVSPWSRVLSLRRRRWWWFRRVGRGRRRGRGRVCTCRRWFSWRWGGRSPICWRCLGRGSPWLVFHMNLIFGMRIEKIHSF